MVGGGGGGLLQLESQLQVQTSWVWDRDGDSYDLGDIWSWPGQGLDRSLTISIHYYSHWKIAEIDMSLIFPFGVLFLFLKVWKLTHTNT